MRKKVSSIFSSIQYFFIPFLIWVFFGLLLQINFSETTIFYFFNGNITNIIFDYLMVLFSFFGRAEFMVIIFLLFLLKSEHRNSSNILLISSFAILNPLLINILKANFKDLRPLKLLGEHAVYHSVLIEKAYLFSFPSGHTMGVFGFFTILTFLLSKQNDKVGFLFFILSCCCGISRIYLGQHFFDDVLMGSIFGVLLSLILIFIFKNINFTK